MRLFKSLLAKAPQFTAPIQPDAPFFAVGDIHGSLDLLKRVPEIADQEDRAAHPIVFVGDYIDRGPDSAGVLRWLQQRQSDMPDPNRLSDGQP